MMLRVLMVGPTPRLYGGISAVAGMLLDSELPQRVELVYVAEGTRQSKLAKLRLALLAPLRLAARLLRRQVDVCHLHVGDGGSFYRHGLYLALCRLSGVPVVLHWHLPGSGEAADAGLGSSRQRRLARWALRHSARIIVLSPAWAATLARLSDDPQTAARLVVLPNPIACAAIQPGDLPAAQRHTLLFLGDFSARKGVRDLLAAAPAVLSDHPRTRLVLGGGVPPADVQALAAPLAAAIEFPGFVRGQEKLRLLQQAALLVLPSYAEGLPVAVLEAMAAGLPVVTTPVGGITDFFVNEVNGLLVRPGDVAALAAALSGLLADPARRAVMGVHNRAQALAHFDTPRYVVRLVGVYEGIRGKK
ncbi:MAG: glycosyltransferase family 4 protein [Caldilineales bacterium]